MIEKHNDEIIKLKEELGIKIDKNSFNLILFDDTKHNHFEVMKDMFEIGLGDRSIEIIREAELKGCVIIQSGKYSDLKILREKLRKKNYRTLIKHIENE